MSITCFYIVSDNPGSTDEKWKLSHKHLDTICPLGGAHCLTLCVSVKFLNLKYS